MEQHSCNGFHLHCRSVRHLRTSGAAQLHCFSPALQVGSAPPDQWSSTAAMVFTCTVSRFRTSRTSGAAQLHWFSPALQVGSAPPDQWSSTAALVLNYTASRFRTARPVEQHSCIGFHLHCRSVRPHRRTSGAAQLHRFLHALQVGSASPDQWISSGGRGTFPPEEPPQPSRPQGSAASSSSGISNAVAEGGPVETLERERQLVFIVVIKSVYGLYIYP